jgi:RNA polymerase sigma-70 factor (ECF subfamily)
VLSDADERQLVEAARSLSEEAWAEIYTRHAQQVYSYIYFRVGDQHTAEDLSADVFVKAIAGIKGYTYRGTPLLAWLYRIAHNVTADYRKSVARRMQHQATDAPEDVEEREDALGMLDDRSDMLAAIRALTEEQQQVIILRFYQGLSNADVARVMGKPEGAVKALQSRGLRSLRRIIGEEQRATA